MLKLIKYLGVGSRGDHPPGSKVEEDAIAAAAAGPGLWMRRDKPG